LRRIKCYIKDDETLKPPPFHTTATTTTTNTATTIGYLLQPYLQPSDYWLIFATSCTDLFVTGWNVGLNSWPPYKTKRANNQPYRATRTQQNTHHYDNKGIEQIFYLHNGSKFSNRLCIY